MIRAIVLAIIAIITMAGCAASSPSSPLHKAARPVATVTVVNPVQVLERISGIKLTDQIALTDVSGVRYAAGTLPHGNTVTVWGVGLAKVQQMPDGTAFLASANPAQYITGPGFILQVSWPINGHPAVSIGHIAHQVGGEVTKIR